MRERQNLTHLVLAVGALTVASLLSGCGGGSGSALPVVPGVSLSPTSITLNPGRAQSFTATVTGLANTSVNWSVQEGAAGGTVNSVGVYVAPSAAGTFHVVAVSAADSTYRATSTVTVAPITVTISPQNPSVSAGGQVTFSSQVQGSSNTGVVWSVQQGAGGGTISGTGLYTAPSTPGTYTIVAASAADPSVQATTSVTVQGTSSGGGTGNAEVTIR